MDSITIENKQNFWDFFIFRCYLGYRVGTIILLLLGVLLIVVEPISISRIVLGALFISVVPLNARSDAANFIKYTRRTLPVFTFTKEKLHIETGKYIKTDIEWKGILKIVEMKKWYLIHPNELSTYYIPKKNFTEEQLIAFQEILANVEVTDKILLS